MLIYEIASLTYPNSAISKARGENELNPQSTSDNMSSKQIISGNAETLAARDFQSILVDIPIYVVFQTDEERAEVARQMRADSERAASFHYANMAASAAPENHDTVVPNAEGLSLKWATVVRDFVQDLAKNPGPGTIYGGYGDKTTHSAVELLGWFNEYIAKLNADTARA